MDRLTTAECVEIVKTYYKNGESVVGTFRALRGVYGRHNRPSERAIGKIVRKFEETGSVTDGPRHNRNECSTANIAAVSESVEEHQNLSITKRAQHLGLFYGTLWRILHLDLHLHPYKIQLKQELKPADHAMRRTYADWVLEQQRLNDDFSHRIFFSDEAHIMLGGYVNKQNCRIWGSENPKVTVERPLHPQKITVWCFIWSGGVIGPYFFENDEGVTQTVNSDRYSHMITEFFFWREIEDMDVENMWFQQDGATSHTTRPVLALLREKFPGRVISRFGNVNWPPRSCDLSPLDFFLWGYAKDRVYADNPQILDALKTNIRQVMAELLPAMGRQVIENYLKKIQSYKMSGGGHLNDVVFHT
ncbi:unnamed protein product [Euphydryas editha]|uniref:DUF4817 domain-containing protein n=1 Tax=Euphydryas editha TaxID=104508 RepID=A0AAU9UQ12_EUPED|nr:unnamed protein product [Euphydryas editha]